MATRKDYKAVASIIKAEYSRLDTTGHEQESRKDVLTTIALRLADYFAKDNSHFDKTKFLIACEFEG